jgi:hypothetical protein
MTGFWFRQRVPVEEGLAKPLSACQGQHVRPQGEGDRHGDCVAQVRTQNSLGAPVVQAIFFLQNNRWIT